MSLKGVPRRGRARGVRHDMKVLNVDNEDALKELMGHRMSVKGAVDQAAGTIHLDKVNQLPEQKC